MTKKNHQDGDTIVVDGRKITVHVLRVRDSANVERLREAAKAAPVDNLDDQVLREHYYPVLAGCSVGDIPTVDEFLDLPLAEGNKWFNKVDELNPGLLPQSEEKEKEKDNSKKEN